MRIIRNAVWRRSIIDLIFTRPLKSICIARECGSKMFAHFAVAQVMTFIFVNFLSINSVKSSTNLQLKSTNQNRHMYK